MDRQLHILQPDPHIIDGLCKSLKISRATAAVLVNRDIHTSEEAFDFLNPSLQNIRSPFSVKDMDTAVRRIFTAITSRERILIFGDYDVDGITSVTILYDFLDQTGADVSFYIPHRLEEGYSIKSDHINKIAESQNIKLIITVDCGSSDFEAIDAANRAGIDVIITDHHQILSPRPNALAMVNPKRPDCQSGFDHLAGVGVVFILLICLRRYLREQNYWESGPEPNLKSFCDLVALGTIADAVPLIQENRIFSYFGINRLRLNPDRPGIDELARLSHIDRKHLNSEDISYRLAPRLNAPGRMDHAKYAVHILKATTIKEARKIARLIENHNTDRKATEQKTIKEIQTFLKSHPDELKRESLVLGNHTWHGGVLGIVASRLADQYCKPVILLTSIKGTIKGSARSIPGFDMYKCLDKCKDSLAGFGGHSIAAGLTLKEDGFDLFKNHFENVVSTTRTHEKPPHRVHVDYPLALNQITHHFIDEIEGLGPFGIGNPAPIFLAQQIRIKNSNIIGKCHRRLTLYTNSNKRGKTINAIEFYCDTTKSMPKFVDQMIFELKWNYWNGNKSPQIIIKHA